MAPVLHVLIADDDDSIRGLLATILGTSEWSVDLVTNGVDAIRAFADRHYDLVITDLEMPGLTGFELTKAIRHLNSTVAVVMITACAPADIDSSKVTELGIHHVIYKPFQITEILALKNMLLEQPAGPVTDFQPRQA